jgi:DNA-directed RNA polymerase specialized sigma24 family protein
MSDHGSAKRGDPLDDLIRTGPPERIARVLFPHVHRIASCILTGRDPDLIETAAGDAVLAVCRHRDDFRGRAKASTWIYAITRRAALHCARREAAYRARTLSWNEESDRELLDEGRAPLPCPLSAREALEALERAVPNPDWRQIWLLWNDPETKRSHAEIASLKGYTAGSVGVILSRVRAQISAACARETATGRSHT